MRESEMVEDVNDSLRMHCNPISRPWSPIPNSLDIVVKLLTVTMTSGGVEGEFTDAMMERGFAIANVTVMEITPSSLKFFVRLWRHATQEEKLLTRTGSLVPEPFV